MAKLETIVVKNVYKTFKGQEVLKGLSLSCYSGEICGIVGHNGSGKTVLFKCICGFLKQNSGEILVKGKSMGKDSGVLEETGIIIEGPAYLDGHSGMDNLDFLYRIRNRKNRAHLAEIMRMVGLDPDSKKCVGKYSMGMKQRLAIAQAIMEDQDILILDEPMNGLDKKGVAEMRQLFLELRDRGKTMLIASHSKDDINILCDNVYEIEDGVLTAVETSSSR